MTLCVHDTLLLQRLGQSGFSFSTFGSVWCQRERICLIWSCIREPVWATPWTGETTRDTEKNSHDALSACLYSQPFTRAVFMCCRVFQFCLLSFNLCFVRSVVKGRPMLLFSFVSPLPRNSKQQCLPELCSFPPGEVFSCSGKKEFFLPPVAKCCS